MHDDDRSRPGPAGVAEPDSETAGAEAEARFLCRRAAETVRGEFEARTGQAFWRVVLEGERPRETAVALGLTINAVYFAKSHVLRRLREEFEVVLGPGILWG